MNFAVGLRGLLGHVALFLYYSLETVFESVKTTITQDFNTMSSQPGVLLRFSGQGINLFRGSSTARLGKHDYSRDRQNSNIKNQKINDVYLQT